MIMVEVLENLVAAAQQFAPNTPIEAIKPNAFSPPFDWSGLGSTVGLVLAILRGASVPLTTRDVALQMLVERVSDVID